MYSSPILSTAVPQIYYDGKRKVIMKEEVYCVKHGDMYHYYSHVYPNEKILYKINIKWKGKPKHWLKAK